ncbi:hypothetical protein G6F68_011217 [Rhizopus microsporus]|nr:hypothetical protein G6F68_011217 [Rhizopus microsporus]
MLKEKLYKANILPIVTVTIESHNVITSSEFLTTMSIKSRAVFSAVDPGASSNVNMNVNWRKCSLAI